MELGLRGLGRMGMGIARRLARAGHRVVAFDRKAEWMAEAREAGVVTAASVEEIATSLSPPRAVWLMVPEGKPVEDMIALLLPCLASGDILIDGGNSYYKDSMRRAQGLKPRGISFVDVGTSGGIWGEREGFCLMIGGEKEAVERLRPIFESLAPREGWLHAGPSGAGHFVKMVHNGVEYGMMQAYAEGFELMAASEFGLDLARVAHLWDHGGVVRSWLLELAEAALTKNPDLSGIVPYVEDSGEGRWTVHECVDRGVPAGVIALSLFNRFRSRQENSFADRLLAALRNEFGGHAIKTKP
jgi:6-phosphogluconate dehydrogenase